MRRPLVLAAAAAAALAALSLLLPFQPVYDPWAWLVWGRELASLELATDAGPSWKPLPVLIDVPLSLLGEAAPEAWLLVARFGTLLAAVLAGALAARLSGPGTGRWRLAAAALAAASVLLAADSFTPPLRQFTGGLSEGLLVALVLAAAWQALEGRERSALWLGVAAALLRPECWPFLAAWAAFAVGRDRSLLPHALAAALLVPLAWFVPDLLAAGNPLEGSETARQGGFELGEVPEVLGRALAAPLAAAWIGIALLAVPRFRQDADGPLGVLLAAAAVWVVLVAAMAVAGYAGLPRFLAPATAVFSIAGGVGLARVAAEGPKTGDIVRSSAHRWRALAGLILLVAVVGLGLRAADVPGDIETIEAQTRSQRDLRELADRLGADRLLACGGRVRVTNVLAQTSLAWWLEEPIDAVRVRRRPRFGIVLTRHPTRLRASSAASLGREGGWHAVRLSCLSSDGRR